MTQTLMLLAIALVVAVVAPFVASMIPGGAIPEAVLLVFTGALLSYWLPFSDNTGMSFLSELGLAFLFLIAGFEIMPSKMSRPMALHASISWFVSLGIALIFVLLLPVGRFSGLGGYAFAITLTTTAYGTLVPIMRERQLAGTPVGNAITVYGATGEVLPIIAMAFLLSVRSKWTTTIVLLIYIAVCVLIASFPRRVRLIANHMGHFFHSTAGTGSESSVRAVTLLLVFLVFLARVMGFDAAFGAFAAGFTLRALLPDGNEHLEERLDAISRGFFVPIFFFVSGASVNLAAAFANVKLLIGFICLLVLVRGVVVATSLYIWPETNTMRPREIFSTAAYCTMALPLIVAVTRVAVDGGAMTSADASVLVTAGAITVLVIPAITSLIRVTLLHTTDH